MLFAVVHGPPGYMQKQVTYLKQKQIYIEKQKQIYIKKTLFAGQTVKKVCMPRAKKVIIHVQKREQGRLKKCVLNFYQCNFEGFA